MSSKLLALPLLVSAALPMACRSQDSVSQVKAESASFTGTPTEVFGLASFVQDSTYLPTLKPYVGPGAAYLAFGERSKFQVATNLTIEARGGSALVGGGQRYIQAQYFLDGYVFNKQLGQGQLVDLGARADLNQMMLNGHIRFLGVDKYVGELNAGFDKTFTRELSIDKVLYGVPMLGVSVGATLGGEIGLKASPGLRANTAIAAIFEPHVQVNAAVTGGVKALLFTAAELRGRAKLVDLRVAGSANLGNSPFNQFVYGQAGFDGGIVDALDGELEIYAKADLGGALPEGVDAKLWEILGIESKLYEYKHTLWNPEPLYTQELPSRGTTFFNYFVTPSVGCDDKVLKTQENLQSRLARLEAETSQLEGNQLRLNKSAVLGLKQIMQKLDAYCPSLTAGEEPEIRQDFDQDASDDILSDVD